MRAEFDVWPTLESNDAKFNVQSESAEKMTVAARLNEHKNIRSLKLSLDEKKKKRQSRVLCTSIWMRELKNNRKE